MLTRDECEKALDRVARFCSWFNPYKCPENLKFKNELDILDKLIEEHFDNPPLKWEERVKFLEKQLDIAIKELCFTAKGADACNSLDNLYEGIKEWIEEQARKEVQE